MIVYYKILIEKQIRFPFSFFDSFFGFFSLFCKGISLYTPFSVQYFLTDLLTYILLEYLYIVNILI